MNLSSPVRHCVGCEQTHLKPWFLSVLALLGTATKPEALACGGGPQEEVVMVRIVVL